MLLRDFSLLPLRPVYPSAYFLPRIPVNCVHQIETGTEILIMVLWQTVDVAKGKPRLWFLGFLDKVGAWVHVRVVWVCFALTSVLSNLRVSSVVSQEGSRWWPCPSPWSPGPRAPVLCTCLCSEWRLTGEQVQLPCSLMELRKQLEHLREWTSSWLAKAEVRFHRVFVLLRQRFGSTVSLFLFITIKAACVLEHLILINMSTKSLLILNFEQSNIYIF